MALVFEDRVATYPNRYKVTPTNGDPAYYVVLERADDPTVVGTPMNAETFNELLGEIEKVLPEVSSADEGKVLTVSDGSWAVGDASSVFPAPTRNSEKKLTEGTGYYFISAGNYMFGIVYWDANAYSSIFTSCSQSSGRVVCTIDTDGSMTLNYYRLENGAEVSMDVTANYDFYTAKITSTTAMASAEGVSF